MSDIEYFLIDEIENKLHITVPEIPGKSNTKTKLVVESNSTGYSIQTESDATIQRVFNEFYKNVVSMKLNDIQTNK